MSRDIFRCISRLSSFGSKVIARIFITAACVWTAAVLSAPAAVAAQPQVLNSHVPKITKKLSAQGRLDANYHMELAIGLPLRNLEQLTN